MEIQAVIEAAPDPEWRTIIALVRYRGLRVPSALLSLRWTDDDLPVGRMTIWASKDDLGQQDGAPCGWRSPHLPDFPGTASMSCGGEGCGR